MTHPSHHTAHQSDQGEILDLDAEVLAEHITSIIAALPLTTRPRHIVDLGCGTGAGTLALLRHFPESLVTAVDSSPAHLHRLREKAAASGVDDRILVVRADLDSPAWPKLGTPDLVWASASMHHMSDPDRTLRQIHDLLAPGGLLAVVELGGFPRFLPATAPEDRPGLEERAHAALDRHHTEHVPHRGADWGAKLTAAGFTVEDEHTLTVNIAGSDHPAVRRYALSGLGRLRTRVAQLLPAEDLAAFERLLTPDDPQSVLHRGDLAMRTERTVWAARPGAGETAVTGTRDRVHPNRKG